MVLPVTRDEQSVRCQVALDWRWESGILTSLDEDLHDDDGESISVV